MREQAAIHALAYGNLASAPTIMQHWGKLDHPLHPDLQRMSWLLLLFPESVIPAPKLLVFQGTAALLAGEQWSLCLSRP